MDFQFIQSLRPNISEYTTVDDDDDDAIAVAEFIVNIIFNYWTIFIVILNTFIVLFRSQRPKNRFKK